MSVERPFKFIYITTVFKSKTKWDWLFITSPFPFQFFPGLCAAPGSVKILRRRLLSVLQSWKNMNHTDQSDFKSKQKRLDLVLGDLPKKETHCHWGLPWISSTYNSQGLTYVYYVWSDTEHLRSLQPFCEISLRASRCLTWAKSTLQSFLLHASNVYKMAVW